MRIGLTFLLFCLSFSSLADLGLKKRFIIPSDQNVNTQLFQVNQTQHNTQRVNVLVWNIYKQIKTSMNQDLKTISRDKDIVLLQEGFLTDYGRELYASLGMEFVFATSYLDKKYAKANSGVLTGARFKPVKHYWQRSTYREPIVGTPKMALFTEYKIAGMNENLLVVNIHGINFVRAYKLRDQLDKVASVVSKHRGPVIVGGDFNTWTRTKLNNMFAAFKSTGLVQVKFKKSPKTVLGKALDHVFYRDLKVVSTDIPSSKASDHKPLCVEFEL